MLRKGMVTAKSQVFEALYAGKDNTNDALAAIIGCTPQTIKRYRQEWNTLQAREFEPLPTYHHGNPDPYRALAAGILRRAVLDYKLNYHCRTLCRPGQYHRCGKKVALFLRSQFAGYLFDAVELPHERVLEKLGLDGPIEEGNED